MLLENAYVHRIVDIRKKKMMGNSVPSIISAPFEPFSTG